jgi:hypothetical protein
MSNVLHTPESHSEHPDFEEYLSILLLEEEISVNNVSERIQELIKPATLSKSMEQTITTQVNRRLIELAIPTPPPKEQSTMPTTQFLNQMDKGCLYATELLDNNENAVYDILTFVKRVSNRKRGGKIRVPSKVRETLLPISNSPTTFSSFLVSLLTHCLCQITAEDLNATYQFVTGRKHNYSKPRQVLEHAEKTHWKDTEIIFRGDLDEMAAEVGVFFDEPTDLTEPTDLHQTVRDLLGMVEKQSKQIQYLSSIVLANQQAPNEDNKVSFSMDKEELLQYLIQNNKLNLTIN